MKNFICTLLLLASLSCVYAGGTGTPYIYTYAGDPSAAAINSLNPPAGALVYDTTSNVWRLKSSPRGSNASYDLFLTGTAAKTLSNATLASPTITGTVAGTFARSGTTTILPAGALILTGTATPAAAGLILVTGSTLKVYLTTTTGIVLSGTGATTF